MKPAPLNVLYEDNHLLAVNKPVGLATIGVSDDEPSLAKLAKDYLKHKYQKPGNVYVGVVSRLDALVSGVVVLARTSKAAARLSEQFRARSVEKTYVAVIEGTLDSPTGTLEDYVAKNDSRHRMEIVPEQTRDAQHAQLWYEQLAVAGGLTLVRIRLDTGRKHQIRLQFAARGHAIIGDKKYGSDHRFTAGIALHALRLVATHPTKQDRLTFHCPPPATWHSLHFADALRKSEHSNKSSL